MRQFIIFGCILQILIIFFSLFNCDAPSEPMINHPPNIESIFVSSSEVEPGGSVEIRVIASDPDGDKLQYSYILTGGNVTSPNSSITLWIAPQYTGKYTITVKVSDGWDYDIANVTIIVSLSSNSSPKIAQISTSADTIAPGGSVEIRVIAVDPDGDKLQYSYRLSGGSITDPDSSVTFWIAPQDTGKYTITVTVSDGKKSVQGSISILVMLQAGMPYITITHPTDGYSMNRLFTTQINYIEVPTYCGIWLTVSPQDESILWYPQGFVSNPNKNGDFGIVTVIGRSGTVDAGKKFDLEAMIIVRDGDLWNKLIYNYNNGQYFIAERNHPDIKAKYAIYVIRISSESSKINGEVSNLITEAPINNCLIYLYNPQLGNTDSTFTDESGKFHIIIEDPKIYFDVEVIALKNGFTTNFDYIPILESNELSTSIEIYPLSDTLLTAKISGIILDSLNNTKIPYAKIQVRNNKDKLITDLYSNSLGIYTVHLSPSQFLEGDTIKVYVEKEGYIKKSDFAIVFSNWVTPLDIFLKPNP